MAEKEVGKIEESMGEYLITVRNELLNGNFDEAKRIEREHLIPPHIIGSISNSVFDGMLRDKKYKFAITLAKKYDLPIEKLDDVVLLEFRSLIAQAKYKEAIEWGMKNKLPEFEISRAAVKGIEVAILEGDVQKAVKWKGDYNINHEQIGTIWQKGYDNAFAEEKFFDAALLCREFGSSERKTLLTAAKALKNSIRKGIFRELPDIETEFHFFNDYSFGLIGDDEAKLVIEVFIEFLDVCVKKADGKTLVSSIDGTRILYSEYTSHFLKGLVHMILKKSIELHGILMKKNKYSEAKNIKEQLGLFEDRVPDDMKRAVLDQATEYHNWLLKESEFETAKDVKDAYMLMGIYSPAELIDSMQKTAVECISNCIRKGEFKRVQYIIDEYNIPALEVGERASEDLKYLLASEMYEVAFDTLLKFKVNTEDEELKEIAAKSFEKCMEKGYFEIAADIGHVFEIKNPDLRKAAKIVWERLMENEDYAKARIVKKKHKLTRKDTQAAAKKAYEINLEKNKIDVAQKIRMEYNVNVGIITWIIELIKSILRIFFKS